MKKRNNITIVCAPFSHGATNVHAKDGPDALLRDGLNEDLIDLGFKTKIIKPPKSLLSIKYKNESKIKKGKIKNLDAILKINNWISEKVSEEIKSGNIPLTLGGDHSLAIGTIAGVHKSGSDFGVLWVDRHLDAHSPKNTPSWRPHGMPVAVAIADRKYDPHPDFLKLLDIGSSKKLPKVKKENVVQIGIGEKSKIDPKTKWYSMEDIDDMGIKKVIDKSVSYLLKRVKYVYVAWDIDALAVTGTGTSGDDQLTFREGLVIARAVDKIRKQGRLIGFEMVEVAPKLERKDLKGQTVSWANKLITTSFGEGMFNNYSKMTRNINIHAN